jgi:hypothetical protein
MFPELEKLSQDELKAKKLELETEDDQIKTEIKQLNKKLRKGLVWWIICIPIIGIAIYQLVLAKRIENNHEIAGELGARKFRQSKITLELMKIKTLLIE